jgi:hypothetical protein
VSLAHGNPSPEQTFLEIGQAHYDGFGLSRQEAKNSSGKQRKVCIELGLNLAAERNRLNGRPLGQGIIVL